MRLATVTAALALAACAAAGPQWEDAARVRRGMSESEVTAILGTPFARAQSGNVATLTWNVDISFGGARTVAFRLLNGKVVERVPSGP
jgi:hypothetical protein